MGRMKKTEFEKKIDELLGRIDYCADFIDRDDENGIRRLEIEELEEGKFKKFNGERFKISKQAKKWIKKYNVPLYYAPFGSYYFYESLLVAKKREEFLRALEEYASYLEERVDYIKDEVLSEIIRDNTTEKDWKKYDTIVVVVRIHAVWNDGQVSTLILCKAENAAEISEIVLRDWGDFGIYGANVDVRVVENKDEVVSKLYEEILEDYYRYVSKYIHHNDVCIMTEEEFFEEEEEEERF